jgi:hypothetical protein
VVVINSPQKIVITSVISQLVSANAKLKVIAKIHKYKRFCEGHHFIPMATEVHSALGHDMDRFIMECDRLFHDKQSKGHLSLSFCIHFFKQRVNIALQHALAFTIKKKIAFVGNGCSRPPNISKFHDLHASNIKRATGDIASYLKRD